MNPPHLTALRLVSANRCSKDAVAERLFASLPESGLVARTDLIPGVTAWVGAVDAALLDIAAPLRRFDCRNNRLALLALGEIAPDIAAARRRYGAERIAVV